MKIKKKSGVGKKDIENQFGRSCEKCITQNQGGEEYPKFNKNNDG